MKREHPCFIGFKGNPHNKRTFLRRLGTSQVSDIQNSSSLTQGASCQKHHSTKIYILSLSIGLPDSCLRECFWQKNVKLCDFPGSVQSRYMEETAFQKNITPKLIEHASFKSLRLIEISQLKWICVLRLNTMII